MSRLPVVRRSAALAVLIAMLASVPSPVAAWPVLDHEVPDEVAEFYDPSIVRSFAISMSDADWDIVRRDQTFSREVTATIVIDGTPLPSPVSVRRKSGIALPTERDAQRVALKVTLDEFDDDQDWMGVTKLSLEGAKYSPVLEGIAWLLHQAASVSDGYGAAYDAALASWATVAVNGRDLGLYLNVEDRGKRFMRNRDMYVNGQSWLYKAASNVVELDVGSTLSPQVSTLCFGPFHLGIRFRFDGISDAPAKCAQPSDSTLTTLLPSLIDMRTMLTLAVVDNVICNIDGMFANRNNFYWADFTYPGATLRRYYPWDIDQGFLRGQCHVYGVGGRATGKIRQGAFEILVLNHPVFREQYRSTYLALTGPGAPLSPEALSLLIAEVEALLSPYMVSDPYARAMYGSRGAVAHFQFLRDFFAVRIPLARAQISANLPAPRAG